MAELGVTQILWTFDPLVSRNAHLNLNALGARVTDYVPDMYGADTGSALHRDRDGQVRGGVGVGGRGCSGAAGRSCRHGGGAAGQRGSGEVGMREGEDGKRLGSEREVVVEIPHDIQQLIAAGPPRRPAVAGVHAPGVSSHFSADGYRVSGFQRSQLPAGFTGSPWTSD